MFFNLDIGCLSSQVRNKAEAPGSIQALFSFVPRGRFELPCPCGRYHLKVVRLPVSPPGQSNYLDSSTGDSSAGVSAASSSDSTYVTPRILRRTSLTAFSRI